MNPKVKGLLLRNISLLSVKKSSDFNDTRRLINAHHRVNKKLTSTGKHGNSWFPLGKEV